MKKNILILVLGLFLVAAACRMPLVLDPGEELDPLPTLVPGEPTALPEPPVSEPSPTPVPAPVEIPLPTDTPEQGDGPDLSGPADQPTPAIPPYIQQPGSPAALPNFTHPDLGCNWMGVAGQVFDTAANPESLVVVKLGGDLAGVTIDQLGITGSAPAYGPGGYEFMLMGRPIGSAQDLWLQLYDLQGNAVSNKVFFDTFNDCARNLILVNFVKLPSTNHRLYLPFTLEDNSPSNMSP
jgi:hypothetical protein